MNDFHGTEKFGKTRFIYRHPPAKIEISVIFPQFFFNSKVT